MVLGGRAKLCSLVYYPSGIDLGQNLTKTFFARGGVTCLETPKVTTACNAKRPLAPKLQTLKKAGPVNALYFLYGFLEVQVLGIFFLPFGS